MYKGITDIYHECYACDWKNWRFLVSGILNIFNGNGSLCLSSQLVKYWPACKGINNLNKYIWYHQLPNIVVVEASLSHQGLSLHSIVEIIHAQTK